MLDCYRYCKDSANAQVQLCQDRPGIFGGACQCGVTVYIRENTILPLPSVPSIVAQPTNQTVIVGNTAQFSVGASGSQPLFYQWVFNGTNLTDNAQITGSQSNVLTLTSVMMSNSGTYEVVVTNAYGSANAFATLTVFQGTPVITWINPAPIIYGTGFKQEPS